MLLRLALSNLAARKTRAGLTVIAIALSVALVVAMTSSFKAFESAAGSFLDQHKGAIDADITRVNDATRGIDPALMEQLKADPQIRHVFARINSEAPMDHNAGEHPVITQATLVGVDRANDPLLDWMKFTDGKWFEPGQQACVIDLGVVEKTGFKVGDTLKLNGPHGSLELPITGIIHKPGLFVGFFQTVYVPIEVAQRFVLGPDAAPRVSMIRLQFAGGVDQAQLAQRWSKRLAEIDPLLSFKLTRTSREEVSGHFMGLRILSVLGGAVAMLAATFIIFSTLSMGVTERQRTLAMLRAIGMTRRQVAGFVLTEGLAIAAAGVLIGIPIGYGLAAIVVHLLRDVFDLSPTLDGLGVAIAAAGALLAAIAAGLMPAWQATRVSPLEAMAPLSRPTRERFPWVATVLGLLLVAMDPLLLFVPFEATFEREIRFYAHFFIGLPAIMLGFFLLAPAFVWTLTHTAGRLLSAIFLVPHAVVKQQLSGGIWRSAGTCAALMVGLSVLVVMQTQGNSSLKSWKLPTNFPDVFIFSRSLGGMTPQAQEKVRNSPLLVADDVMPIGSFAPEVPFLGLMGTQLPGNTMYVAIDPNKAFRLMELDFRQGNPTDAARLLKQGGHLIITEEMSRLRRINLGDSFQIKSMTKGTLNYTVAAVVWSPGIDVMINSFDMSRQFEQQSQACVFGTLDDARASFGVQNVSILCANFRRLGVPKQELIHQLQTDLKDTAINVADVRQLKAGIQEGLSKLLAVATTVAWGALLVASLGVTNTIVASIRSRYWQFGVLRSIGLTRGALLRIVLAEALLLGVIGAAMGLACGTLMTFDARQFMSISIGHHPPLMIPWSVITLGAGAVVTVSLIASILPAFRLARTEPLSLLSAGRSAT